MASSGSSHVKDTDEKFCQCSKCLQQYREPKQLPCLHRFEIEEDEESPVKIEGVRIDEYRIDGITGVDDGSIVITGHSLSLKDLSLITVVNMSGKVLRHKKLKGTFLYPERFCANLSELKLATVCSLDEIGVFGIRDYSYFKKNIRDFINIRPEDQNITCVTTDPVNNHIFVGSYYTRDVYVFDDQLNYHHTLTLPEKIDHPRDMAFSEGNLIVCDFFNKRACFVTTERQGAKVTHELRKPACGRDDWGPSSVCTDSNGFIYILWMTGSSYTDGRRVIVKYTQDGSQSITQKNIDTNEARCITTVKTNSITEKLLIANHKSEKLHIFTIF